MFQSAELLIAPGKVQASNKRQEVVDVNSSPCRSHQPIDGPVVSRQTDSRHTPHRNDRSQTARMHAESSAKTNFPVGIKSLPGVLSILVALGIIFIGIREYFYPEIGAFGFGVPLLDPRDGDLLAIKAVRDVVSGLIVLTVLALRDRRALTAVIGVLALIPILDGLIVFKHSGWNFTPVILVHWGTAIFMLLIVALLVRGKSPVTRRS